RQSDGAGPDDHDGRLFLGGVHGGLLASMFVDIWNAFTVTPDSTCVNIDECRMKRSWKPAAHPWPNGR
ncbi:hypothetical protein, partial [Streptomyces sp. NPDC004284]|uniref:hypothetical protein n=1 Tax=Streptomyces sp. NPDC004284 TaxID=3364695 RepID=UPI0036802EAA